jgi:hypothetical protein
MDLDQDVSEGTAAWEEVVKITGEIYDLTNVALNALRGRKDSVSKGVVMVLEEIRDRNTRINTNAYYNTLEDHD